MNVSSRGSLPMANPIAAKQNCCSDRQQMQTTETDLLGTVAKGAAIRIHGQMYQQALRHGAIVDLTADDEFEIQQTFIALGMVLAAEEPAVVLPITPFDQGGKFHPSNLELIEEPDPVDLKARRDAGPPLFQVGNLVRVTDFTGQDSHRCIAEIRWNPEDGDWCYGMSLLVDEFGNVDYEAQTYFSSAEILAVLHPDSLPTD